MWYAIIEKIVDRINLNKLRIKLISVVFVFVLSCLNIQLKAQQVTMGTLLNEMTNRESLAKYPLKSFETKQFSSYDRRAKEPGGENWFANEDRTNFLRRKVTENGSEWVMFDSDKPGAIVRWWMTFAGEGAGDGTIRIYIDDSETPTIEGRAFDLISGGLLAEPPLSVSVSPTTEYTRRGHNLYLPIPYNSCKVTYQGSGIKENEKGEILDGSVAIYYIINYREYNEGTSVESFDDNTLDRYLEEINKAQLALLDPYADIFRKPADETMKLRRLSAGENMHISLKGEKQINALTLKIEAEEQPQALRSTVISFSFDGKKTLTIPVGDFFGTGYEINPYETYYTKVFYDGTMASFWPMPFQSEAEIEITNYGEQEVSVQDVQLYTGDWIWDDRSMYFGGSWKQFYKKQTGGGEDPEDLNFVTLEGKGVYVGDLVTIYNDAPAWWGEGDEKIYIDGEDFPSHFGTGSEDYYGYAWSRPEFFEHPFIAQPDGSGNMEVGTAVNIRFRALDKIPFNLSLDMNMELWHWVRTNVDYAPTTFFYLRPEAKALHDFDPEQAKQEVRFAAETAEDTKAIMINNSIQGEKMEPIRIDAGILETQRGKIWDDNAHLWWRRADVGDMLYLQFISNKAYTNSNIELQLTKAKDYGIVGITLNDEQEITFDGYAPEVSVEKIQMENANIKEGNNTLKIVVKGKNDKALEGNMFGIDYMEVK